MVAGFLTQNPQAATAVLAVVVVQTVRRRLPVAQAELALLDKETTEVVV